ncbi:MAG TPA: hypothetical protein VKA37_05650 [Halobacteriales archaeon]|nr:hypothetical protein [Halobacteriales archaeon]
MPSIALNPEGLNDVCDVLGHHHRRFVIADLAGRAPPVDLGGLAARAANWDRNHAGSGPATRDQVEVELHHRHLPKLHDSDLLSYDPSERTIVDWPELDLPDEWPSDPSIEAVLAAWQADP